VTGFGSYDNCTRKRVLDLLEPGDLMRANCVCTSVAQSRRHCCYDVIATIAAVASQLQQQRGRSVAQRAPKARALQRDCARGEADSNFTLALSNTLARNIEDIDFLISRTFPDTSGYADQ